MTDVNRDSRAARAAHTERRRDKGLEPDNGIDVVGALLLARAVAEAASRFAARVVGLMPESTRCVHAFRQVEADFAIERRARRSERRTLRRR